jgi:AcrR family transcriptional regulator
VVGFGTVPPRRTPTAPTRRTPTAEVRAALVDAAATVLERDGLAALTVRAVAAEAGVAPMGVYNHLEGKTGLITAVLERAFADLRTAVSPDPALGAPDRLVAAGLGYRRFALAHPITYTLMFGTVDPPVDTKTTPIATADAAFQALVDTVIGAQAAGIARAGDPTDLALQIWSAVHGAVSLELTGNLRGAADAHAGSAVDADHAYDNVLAMITRGIAPD